MSMSVLKTSGKLKSLKVSKGDRVEIGQLLAEIDPVPGQYCSHGIKCSTRKYDFTAFVEGSTTFVPPLKLQRDRK